MNDQGARMGVRTVVVFLVSYAMATEGFALHDWEVWVAAVCAALLIDFVMFVGGES